MRRQPAFSKGTTVRHRTGATDAYSRTGNLGRDRDGVGHMLRVLISSQPVRDGWIGSSAFSTVTHGALIALAVVGTTQQPTMVHEERAVTPERITYIQTARYLVRQPTAENGVKAAPAKPSE